MTENEILKFGFRKEIDDSFSKSVQPEGSTKPFYLTLQASNINNVDWILMKEGNLVSIARSPNELRQAILAACSFDAKCLE